MKPDSSRNGEEYSGHEDGVGATDPIQQGDQNCTSGSGPNKIVKVGPVDTFQGVSNDQRNDGPGQEERRRGDKVSHAQLERTEIAGSGKQEPETQYTNNGVRQQQASKLLPKRSAPPRRYVRKHSACAESE